MAEDDEDFLNADDTSIEGAAGEGTEGQDPGDGDEGSEVPAEQSDAPSGEDDGASARGGDEEDRPVSRGANRVQRLANERNELREELAAIRREREAERQRTYTQQQQWEQEQLNQRWAVMTPEEKVEYLAQEGQNRLTGLQQQFNAQFQMMRDQTAYEAKAAVHPTYAKYQKEVERMHNEYLQQGRFITRELILKNLLGERALQSATKDTAKGRRIGQKKIEAQTTRPSSSKGDATSVRGKSGDTAEKRLAGVEI